MRRRVVICVMTGLSLTRRGQRWFDILHRPSTWRDSALFICESYVMSFGESSDLHGSGRFVSIGREKMAGKVVFGEIREISKEVLGICVTGGGG